MSRANGSVMRYLLSSAFLNGPSYRKNIKEFVKSDIKLLAPENGVDMQLLVNTCEKLDRRDLKYELLFTFLTFTFLILLAVASESRSDSNFANTGILVNLLIAGTTWIIKERKQRKWVKHFFNAKTFNKNDFEQEFLGESVFPEYAHKQGENIVIYDGFNPFIGSGLDLDGWSISIDLSKKKDDITCHDEADIKDFELDELYECLSENLKSLGFSKLSIKDMLFVNGTDIKDIDWMLPDKYKRPISSVKNLQIKNFYASSNKQVRHYKLVQVADWENDIILSFYIRFSLQSDNLFVEVSRFLLTPIASQYRKIDSMATLSTKKKLSSVVVRFLFGGLFSAYSTLLFVARIQNLLSEIFISQSRRVQKEVDDNPLFNYGAKTTIRESYSGEEYQHYFQKLDKELYFKTLERSFLDTIVSFLDSHNIDTNELGERRTTIINSGIIVKGGDVNAGSLAVGKKAKAKNN